LSTRSAPAATALAVVVLAAASCGGDGDGNGKDLEAIESCLKDARLEPTSIAPKEEAEAESGGGDEGAAIEGALVVAFPDQAAAHVDVYADEEAAAEAFDAQRPLLEAQGQGIEHSGNVVLSSTKGAPSEGVDKVRACAV
jgi:hypothetical protein